MVDPITQFIVDLFILLASAVIAGEIAVHLGQVAMVGQLLVGVTLGPTLLGPYIGLTSASLSPGSGLGSLQFLAIVFVLFLAGLEVTPERIYRMGTAGFTLGTAIFLVPLGVGTLLTGLLLPDLPFTTRGLVAVTLSITALPVMGIMLTEFQLQDSRLGQTLMNAALVNEFLAVAIFSVLLRLGPSSADTLVSVAIAVLSVGVFLGAVTAVHMLLKVMHSEHVWEKTTQQFAGFWRSKQGAFALLMVMLIGSTLFSQFLGMTYVMGAFFAGVLVTKESAGAKAHESISYIFDAMSWGFFVPLFFVFVGVQMNLRTLDSLGVFLVFVVLAVAMSVTKIGTGAGIASLLGWKDADALAMGHLVNSRGGVQLAMAIILVQTGTITTPIFTIVAGVGIITTILAPMGALSVWLADPKSREALLKRVPTLRARSPSLRQLRPPVEWHGSHEPDFDARSEKLREWLERPISERSSEKREWSARSPTQWSSGSEAALLPPTPGAKEGEASKVQIEGERPPLPSERKRPRA